MQYHILTLILFGFMFGLAGMTIASIYKSVIRYVTKEEK